MREIVTETGINLQTYEEMHLQIDRDIYGITDDPSLPYQWDTRPQARQDEIFPRRGPAETVIFEETHKT